MHARKLFAAAVAAALLMSPAHAQLAEWWRTCTGQPDAEWDQQIKSCTAIIESGQESGANLAKAYYNRGRVRFETNEYDRSIADLDEAIRLNPTFADAYFARGVARYYSGSVRLAIDDYSEAIRLDPNHADAYFYRAFAWRMRNDYDRAIADLTEVIRIDPKDTSAYELRGNDWFYKGEIDRAIADFTEAIRIDPKYVRAYSARGRAWVAKGEYDRAIADYAEALQVEPENADLNADRGFVHFYRGDFPASATDLHRAIELQASGIKALHVALFRYLARSRAGQDAMPELTAHYAPFVGRHDVFELYLGRGSPDAVLNPSAGHSRPSYRCEAEFYVGEWHLIRGNRGEARRLFQAAAADQCRDALPAYPAAVTELKRMDP